MLEDDTQRCRRKPAAAFLYREQKIRQYSVRGDGMKVKEVMTKQVISIQAEERVDVAARMLERYNIGALPVCAGERLCGMVTDRDLAVRCLAQGKWGSEMRVRDVMTERLICAEPDMDAEKAARLMGMQQVRRLPVVENGQLSGIVSLGDLAGADTAGGALAAISSSISAR